MPTLCRVSTVEPTGQRKKGDEVAKSVPMKANRSFLRYVAFVLFVLSAIFLFAGISSLEVDLGLLAVGLAAWAIS